MFGVPAAPAARKPLPNLVGRFAAHRLEGVSKPPGPPGAPKINISGRLQTMYQKPKYTWGNRDAGTTANSFTNNPAVLKDMC